MLHILTGMDGAALVADARNYGDKATRISREGLRGTKYQYVIVNISGTTTSQEISARHCKYHIIVIITII